MNERELAVDILMEMDKRDAYGHILLRERLNRAGGGARQKAFTVELVNGCVRRRILLDYIIDCFSKTPSSKMKPFILTLLRVSVYQLRFMDRVPAAAAVDEAVKLTKKRGFGALSGFVNAVLRSVVRQADQIQYPQDPTGRLSVLYSYPEWLAAYLIQRFGFSRAERICQAETVRPKMHLCVNTTRVSQPELTRILEAEGVTAALDGQNGIQAEHTDNIQQKPSFQKGFFHVMDESAMRAVETLAPVPGGTLLDLCAAPGGKSFYSAYLMENRGRIVACDIHPGKLRLVQRAAERLGLSVMETRLLDARAYHVELDQTADRLILDAPCSGLGVIRKKPDLKYRKTEADIHALAALQREMLENSWRYVKPGGALVYSTCTITTEENAENVRWFAARFPFMLESAVQIWPDGRENRDGFYIARFVRDEE
ncbi:MAG: 16S rRNA (cytosine(967)-C(5))-methyltransferase RsmB [Clostridiales bacterium]|nr:16S rRNA (cytosine(967)-C(5))-methyltransferase RsmB [Clostridiales bacterium]